jgi:hypothetical protein
MPTRNHSANGCALCATIANSVNLAFPTIHPLANPDPFSAPLLMQNSTFFPQAAQLELIPSHV